MKIDKLIEPSGKAPLFHQLRKSLCYSLENNEMFHNEKKIQLPNENLIRYTCIHKQ